MIVTRDDPTNLRKTATQRKEQELSSLGVGGSQHYSIKRHAKLEDADIRKTFNWYDSRSEVVKERSNRSPAVRRLAEQQSTVFGPLPCTSSTSHVVSDTKIYERTSLDIEGSSPYKPRCKHIGKRLQSQQQSWAVAEVRPKTTKAYNPQEHSAKQQRSQMDPNYFAPTNLTSTSLESKKPVYQIDPRSMKQYNLTRVEQTPQLSEAMFITLDVTGLDTACTEDYLRGLCRSFQIVSASPRVNSITGNCTGSAIVQARVSDPQASKQLQARFVEQGYKVQEAVVKAGRNTNYFDCKGTTFLDPHSEIAQRRLTSQMPSTQSASQLHVSNRSRTSLAPSDDSFKELQKWKHTRQMKQQTGRAESACQSPKRRLAT